MAKPRLVIFTVGSRGDVQPYIALGCGLKRAGYPVCLATHALFEPMIRAYGLDFLPVTGNPQEIIQKGQGWLESGRNPIKFITEMSAAIRPLANQVLADSITLSRQADVLLCSTLTLIAGDSVATERGIRMCEVPLQPMLPTRAHPSFLLPLRQRWSGLVNIATHHIANQLMWQPFRAVTNRWRRDTLNLPPYPFFGPFAHFEHIQMPYWYAFSPTVVPRPDDWPTQAQIMGYYFLDPLPDWTPPAELVTFLETGPPPVYIGFGSMLDRHPAAFTELLITALAQTGQRGILASGWAKLHRGDLPDTIYPIEAIPHSWLFPQMAAVVHHGGAGTTAAGLRAGVPSIFVPFFADQFFWAEQSIALGVGPPLIPRKQLTAARLAHAITAAVTDPHIQQAAQAVGQQIRAEDGVQQTIAALETWLSTA